MEPIWEAEPALGCYSSTKSRNLKIKGRGLQANRSHQPNVNGEQCVSRKLEMCMGQHSQEKLSEASLSKSTWRSSLTIIIWSLRFVFGFFFFYSIWSLS